MLDRYLTFDVNKLIEDHDDNIVILKNLKSELRTLDGFKGGSDGEKVQTSPRQDGLENDVLSRIRLENEIYKYETMLTAYDIAWDQLDEEEQFILKQFNKKGQSKRSATVKSCEKLAFADSTIRKKRKDATDKFKRLFMG